jgi:hypothetical protein
VAESVIYPLKSIVDTYNELDTPRCLYNFGRRTRLRIMLENSIWSIDLTKNQLKFVGFQCFIWLCWIGGWMVGVGNLIITYTIDSI